MNKEPKPTEQEQKAYEAGFNNGRSGGISEATLSLKERIVELETLLQQKDMRIRHLEERLKERGDTIKFIKQKEVNDEQ